MNQEEFLRQYGQEAWDLFEQYMRLDRSARAIAQQLKANYGISVSSEEDRTPLQCQGHETPGTIYQENLPPVTPVQGIRCVANEGNQ